MQEVAIAPRGTPLKHKIKTQSDSETSMQSIKWCQLSTKEHIVTEGIQMLPTDQVQDTHRLWDYNGFLNYVPIAGQSDTSVHPTTEQEGIIHRSGTD